MPNNEPARELIMQIIRSRMTFRQTLQRVLKCNNIDMTFEMLQIMSCLWKAQGVSQQYLAEKTAKDKACLTNLINNLEKKGWVVRKEDPSDRRNRLVFLTIKGEQVSETVKPLIKEVYVHAGERMGVDQITQCISLLQQLDEALNEVSL